MQTSITYEPILADNGNQLTCTFIQTDKATGEEMKKSVSTKILVQKTILPKSPFIAKDAQFGQEYAINIEMELFPEPKTDGIIWVVGFPDGREIELKPCNNTIIHS